MNTNYCVVLCTCPDSAVAEKLAQLFTELKLVACTNIVPHLTSLYPWQGNLVKGSEVLMVMKTHQDKLADLEKSVVENHPYDFPEFIALPIIYGNSKYLKWVDEVVSS